MNKILIRAFGFGMLSANYVFVLKPLCLCCRYYLKCFNRLKVIWGLADFRGVKFRRSGSENSGSKMSGSGRGVRLGSGGYRVPGVVILVSISLNF